MKNLPGIDLFKFIMAVFVVGIHTHPFENFEPNLFIGIWNKSLVSAVPYFFIASGFFLFLKIYSSNNLAIQLSIIRVYAKKIITLYTIWTCIYLPITFWWFYTNTTPFDKDLISFIRAFFFIGENYYSWPLWYLLSMFYSLIVIYLLKRIGLKYDFIFVFSMVLFFIAFKLKYLSKHGSEIEMINSLKPQLKFVLNGGRNLTGLMYIMIGAFLAKHSSKLSKSSIALIFLIGIYFQIFREKNLTNFLYVLIPASLFYFSINLKFKNSRLFYFLRKSSTVMYFTHMIVVFLYTYFFKEFKYYGFDIFIVATLIPILITIPILKYENRFKFLKRIF